MDRFGGIQWGRADLGIGRRGTITLWDVRTASKVGAIKAYVNNREVSCLASAGSKIASGGDDGWIKLWDFGSEGNFSQYTLILTRYRPDRCNPTGKNWPGELRRDS